MYLKIEKINDYDTAYKVFQQLGAATEHIATFKRELDAKNYIAQNNSDLPVYTADDLKNMPLHSQIHLGGNYYLSRVINGWLYEQAHTAVCTFVPESIK